jgi:hypothetical protein
MATIFQSIQNLTQKSHTPEANEDLAKEKFCSEIAKAKNAPASGVRWTDWLGKHAEFTSKQFLFTIQAFDTDPLEMSLKALLARVGSSPRCRYVRRLALISVHIAGSPCSILL